MLWKWVPLVLEVVFSEGAAAITFPAMLNGRIEHAGETDEWPLDLEKDQTINLEVLAEAFGSKLDSMISIVDQRGRNALVLFQYSRARSRQAVSA